MNKEQLIEKVETMMQDNNYYINSKKGTEKQLYAWEYAREVLKIVLIMVKALE